MTSQEALRTLLDGADLTRAQARAVMGEIMSGEATQAQIADARACGEGETLTGSALPLYS